MTTKRQKRVGERSRVKNQQSLEVRELNIVDEDARRVRLTFSSETPVQRHSWWDGDFIEVLGHDDGEVRMERLQDNATVFRDHRSTTEHAVGVVEEASIVETDGVRKGQAVVRFSQVEDLATFWEMIREGTLSKISVGYWIHERVLVTERDDGLDEYRITDWEPAEISVVGIPADPTASMNRGTQASRSVNYEVEVLPSEETDDMARKPQRGERQEDLALDQEEDGTTQPKSGRANRSGLETRNRPNPGKGKVDRETETDEDQEDSDEEERDADVAYAVRAENARQSKVRSVFDHAEETFVPGNDADTLTALRALRDKCLNDPKIGEKRARALILEQIGEGQESGGADAIQVVRAEEEKHLTAATTAFLARGLTNLGITKDRDGNELKRDRSNPFAGASLMDAARFFLERKGETTFGKQPMEIARRAMSASDFPRVLANVSENALLLGYEGAPETWRQWCLIGSLSDFKIAERAGLSSFDRLDRLTDHGEYREGRLVDRGVSIKVDTYGKTFGVTRETLINDEIGAFTETPAKLGRAAAATVGDAVYGLLTSNPVLGDGIALFAAEHNNLNAVAEAPLEIEPLQNMETAMGTQTDDNNQEAGLNIMPGFLLVPRALMRRAGVLTRSAVDPRFATANPGGLPNPIQGIAEPISDPRLDQDSATRYYMVASRQFDTLEVAFLNGQETPEFFTDTPFDYDGMKWKVRLDFGVAIRDFRAFQRNDGTSPG